MKLKDCVNMMKHKSKKFALLNQLTPTTKLSIAKDHNLIIIKDNEIEFMEKLASNKSRKSLDRSLISAKEETRF